MLNFIPMKLFEEVSYGVFRSKVLWGYESLICFVYSSILNCRRNLCLHVV